jgi:hypothetical protein
MESEMISFETVGIDGLVDRIVVYSDDDPIGEIRNDLFRPNDVEVMMKLTPRDLLDIAEEMDNWLTDAIPVERIQQ